VPFVEVKSDHLAADSVRGTYDPSPTHASSKGGRLILSSSLKIVLELLDEFATGIGEGAEPGISASEMWCLVFGNRYPDEVTEGELYEARDLRTCLTEDLLSPPDIGLVLGSQ
jgi:hypothetical protein